MAAIKLHVYRIEMGDSGTESCDYRGAGEHGAGENDQHRTVYELDPANESAINGALMKGPKINQMFGELASFLPNYADSIASLLGLEGHGPVGIRIGVWDQ